MRGSNSQPGLDQWQGVKGGGRATWMVTLVGGEISGAGAVDGEARPNQLEATRNFLPFPLGDNRSRRLGQATLAAATGVWRPVTGWTGTRSSQGKPHWEGQARGLGLLTRLGVPQAPAQNATAFTI